VAAPDVDPTRSVDAVERLPALGGAELVRVRGRGDAGPPALAAGERRLQPLADGPLGREPGTWSASFVLPSDAAGEPAWLEWPGGPRLALPPVSEPDGAEVIARAVLDERRSRRASHVPEPLSRDPSAAEAPSAAPAAADPSSVTPPPEAASAAGPPPVWQSHRSALERELARAAEVAASARDEAAGRIATHAADMRAARSEAAARVTRAEEVAAAAGARLRGAVAAAATAEARLHSEAIARGALEAELARLRAEIVELAEALAAERVTREAAGRALAAATADALAAKRVRAAEAAAASALAGELDAERAAHAVTRGTAARLRDELAATAAPATAAPPPAAKPTPPAGAISAPAELRRLAAAQAAGIGPAPDAGRLIADLNAAAVPRRPVPDAGRLVADLDAAAAALRARDLGPPRRLRDALVSFAREDPQSAGALLAQMLPSLGAVVDGRASYDVAITGVGIYAVTVADGGTRAVRLRRLRPRGKADLALIADPLALAEWLAGEEVRVGRWRGRIRRRGARGALAPLSELPAGALSFTDAARAGARPDPGLVFRTLAHAIDPDWTRGHTFTVAQTIDDQTWHLTARDGEGLEVVADPAAGAPDATVTLTRAAFDSLLRDEPPPRDELPSIRGDRSAVTLLRDWADQVRRAR
jgi:hypothetical protein